MGSPFSSTSISSLILDSVADGVFTVDRDWNIMSFNAAASANTSVAQDKAVGQKCWDVFKTYGCQNACVLRFSIHEARANNTSVCASNTHFSSVPH